MHTTQTERLLQQAKSICTDVTENSEISDELLCSVFERLCMESDIQENTDDSHREVGEAIH